MSKLIGATAFFVFFLVGCTNSVYVLNEKVPLVGDYSNAETLDYYENEEKPPYILVSEIACTERSAKCVILLEIDYERFADDISFALKECDIDTENINYSNPPSEEQAECARVLLEGMG